PTLFRANCPRSSTSAIAFTSCTKGASWPSWTRPRRRRRRSGLTPQGEPTMSLLEQQTGRSSRQLLRRYGMLLVLLAMMLLASLLSDRFLTSANLMNVTRQVAINAILAAGMTVVILSGGIDLSVGSVLALTCAVGAGMMASGGGWLAAVLVMLGLGTLLCVLNEFLIDYRDLLHYTFTLTMMAFTRGATMVYASARPIPVLDPAFRWFDHGSERPIPAPVLIMVVLYEVL